jgi:primase-polymerase (primpol)-like protein
MGYGAVKAVRGHSRPSQRRINAYLWTTLTEAEKIYQKELARNLPPYIKKAIRDGVSRKMVGMMICRFNARTKTKSTDVK